MWEVGRIKAVLCSNEVGTLQCISPSTNSQGLQWKVIAFPLHDFPDPHDNPDNSVHYRGGN